MRRLLVLFIAAGALGQTPDDDQLLSRLAVRETPRQRLLAEQPGAVEHLRLPNANIFRLPDGRYRGLFGPGLGWVDPDTGQIQVNESALWTTQNGWLLVGTPVKARISRNVDGTDDVAAFRRSGGRWQAIALAVPRVTHVGEFLFTFADQGLDWEMELPDTGFELRSKPIAAPLGVRTYQFAHRKLNVSLSVDGDGNLTEGGDFRLSRAVMQGANGATYPCGAWEFGVLNRIRFACDDSALPPEAFPYRIDPTYDATTDDGSVKRGPTSCTTWPPSSCSATTDSTSSVMTVTYTETASNTYHYALGFMRFDTSSIPDNGTVTTATLNVYVSGINAVSPWKTYGDYQAWSPLGSSDWVAPGSLVGTAFIVDQSLWSAGWKAISLDNVSNVSKTGYTELRWGLRNPPTDPAPNTNHQADFHSADDTNKPYLEVTYQVPGWPKLIVVAQQ